MKIHMVTWDACGIAAYFAPKRASLCIEENGARSDR
jgi:hypothetical protein